MHEEGWYKDPYGLHMDRWYSDGKPTALVRDGDRELKDPAPESEPRMPLEPSLQRDVAPKQEYTLPMNSPGLWGGLTRFAFSSSDGKARRTKGLAKAPLRHFVGRIEKARQSPENWGPTDPGLGSGVSSNSEFVEQKMTTIPEQGTQKVLAVAMDPA